MTGRPIRFGIQAAPQDATGLVDVARAAEEHGYSTIALNDHLSSTVAPLLGLQAIAGATSNIRLATAVLNQDLRHPAVLAKELATLDLLSGGRLEVGLGAGWVGADYEQSGIVFDPAPQRIERVDEVMAILDGAFSGEPFTFAGKHFTITGLTGTPRPIQPGGPPILVGGGGPQLLATAARHADIIQVLGTTLGDRGAVVDDLSSFHLDAYQERVGWIADAAGPRFDEIELSVHLAYMAITDDVEREAAGFLEYISATVARYGGAVGSLDVRIQTLVESPVVAIGSLDDVCAKLQRVRDTLGFSYFVVPYGSTPHQFAPVVERLAGS